MDLHINAKKKKKKRIRVLKHFSVVIENLHYDLLNSVNFLQPFRDVSTVFSNHNNM